MNYCNGRTVWILPERFTIRVGLRLVINFAYADATRTVVTDRTVVANLKTSEDVTKTRKTAVKYKMPVTQYSEGTSLEGNLGAVRPAVVYFSHLAFAQPQSFFVFSR